MCLIIEERGQQYGLNDQETRDQLKHVCEYELGLGEGSQPHVCKFSGDIIRYIKIYIPNENDLDDSSYHKHVCFT